MTTRIEADREAISTEMCDIPIQETEEKVPVYRLIVINRIMILICTNAQYLWLNTMPCIAIN